MSLDQEPNLQIQGFAESSARHNKSQTLSLDVDIATCQVLAALSENGTLPADAFVQLVEHNKNLRGSPSEVIEDSLTRQSALLESLWLHFAARAAAEPRPDHASSLIKAALNCQRALSNVLGTIHHLSNSKEDAEAITS